VPLERDETSGAHGSQVTIGVRPEDLVVSNTRGEGLQVEVDLVEELGADGYLYGHSELEGRRTDIVARVDGRLHPNAGDVVYLMPQPRHLHVFDVETGERLSHRAVVS
jgi:multiple sugar transport system ATP-binding protein